MKIDAALTSVNLKEMPTVAQAAEAMGFDGVWTSETQHEAFLPLPLVAEHTQRIQFGTAIAVAFARSPTILAHIAWDLAAQSGGRFILGLGTQVKAHVERRFGMKWESPAPKLRDTILALRAIWNCWQHTLSHVFGRVIGVHVEPIRQFTRQPTQTGIDARNKDRYVRRLDGAGAKEWRHQCELVKLPAKIQRRTILPAVPDCVQRQDHFSQLGCGRFPFHPEPSLDVRLDLCAQTQDESPA